MNTAQLQCMIQCDSILSDYNISVFAADQLPRGKMNRPYGFIANTDVHSKQGRHWCAFFCDSQGDIDFFDSFGRSLETNSTYFDHWIQKRSHNVRVNTQQLQSDESNVCGLYCILFLRNRLLGLTMVEFIDRFDKSDLVENDTFVYELLSKAYPCCIKNDVDYPNQTCCSLVKRFSL